ncbi:MAG: BREX-1 system phosphatase PglZ type B [Blastocatellia bacterium]|nr:BREX-1 system phosphatase PglZ type B [Blastocatellia bacterium]
MRVIEALLKAVRSAAAYNPEVQVAPACILWPDADRQWEAVIPRLQQELAELLVLGEYAVERRTGPAIWLRCAIAGVLSEVRLPPGQAPILYLPGVSRQELRAVDHCPEHLKPLAELQYRGVLWSQLNAKDWTILAFLKSDQGGLGLDVAQDNETRNAMQFALSRLVDEDVELLKGKRLDKDYFNTLLTGGDPVRDLLLWLDQGEIFRNGRGENEWKAFVEVCISQLGFNPQSEGVLTGASKLAAHKGPWQAVWERFCEAPKRYPQIPRHIRKCSPPAYDLFTDADSAGGWPQWNEEQEGRLRQDLLALGDLPAHEAGKKLLELEKLHGQRRQLIWAELEEAPLACALEPLALLVEATHNGLAAGTAEDLAKGYQDRGWRADQAVMAALSHVDQGPDFDAVKAAIRAVYLPWVEESARHLQKVVAEKGYPGDSINAAGTLPRQARQAGQEGECILFVDGLRFDAARQLSGYLTRAGCELTERVTWAALPSVTATGKAAVAPVSDKIRGKEANTDFEPCVAETGQSLKGGNPLKKLLTENGWKVLGRSDNGDGKGNAWCEFGDLDHEGHDRGWKLAKHLAPLLMEIATRITGLLDAGWKRVRVVTDHGWLLLPGGLPKIELSSVLAESKWGRCAVIKTGASTDERLYPWFWNPNQLFALADGISCFRKGEEYAHGGLSLQECLTLELTVSRGNESLSSASLEFTDIRWNGLRCTIAVNEPLSGLTFDIRTEPGNAASSVVVSAKPLKANGTASVVVEDEELAGRAAALVLLDENGALAAQAAVVIGGGNE